MIKTYLVNAATSVLKAANKVASAVMSLAEFMENRGLLTVDLVLLYSIALVITSQTVPMVVPALALVPLAIWFVLRFYAPEE